MNNFDYTKTPPSFEGVFNNWQLPKKQGKGLQMNGQKRGKEAMFERRWNFETV